VRRFGACCGVVGRGWRINQGFIRRGFLGWPRDDERAEAFVWGFGAFAWGDVFGFFVYRTRVSWYFLTL